MLVTVPQKKKRSESLPGKSAQSTNSEGKKKPAATRSGTTNQEGETGPKRGEGAVVEGGGATAKVELYYATLRESYRMMARVKAKNKCKQRKKQTQEKKHPLNRFNPTNTQGTTVSFGKAYPRKKRLKNPNDGLGGQKQKCGVKMAVEQFQRNH